MDIKSDFLNISTKRPARSGCLYQHKLELEILSGETLIDIEIENLPLGLEYNKETMSIIGNMDNINNFHECKDYISKEFQNLDDSYVFSGYYNSLDDLTPLTAKYLKNLKDIHYSGLNFGKVGDLAFVGDGNKIYQKIKIIIKYNYYPPQPDSSGSGDSINSSQTPETNQIPNNSKIGENIKEFNIDMELEVSNSPKKFVLDYGKSNELIGYEEKPCSAEEYIKFCEEQGFKILDGCS